MMDLIVLRLDGYDGKAAVPVIPSIHPGIQSRRWIDMEWVWCENHDHAAMLWEVSAQCEHSGFHWTCSDFILERRVSKKCELFSGFCYGDLMFYGY